MSVEDTTGAPGRSRAGRLARMPLWAHAAALLVLLLVLAPSTRPSDLWSADEGAVRLQAESLADGPGWLLPRPLPELDPAAVTVPIHDSVIDGDSYVPYSKHPVTPLSMAPLVAMFGTPWAIAPSLIAVVIAAALSGMIGARFGRGIAVASLWSIGVLSPMLLYGFTVLGHTAGAAMAAALGLAVIASLEGRRASWVVAVAASLVGPLFRSEAALLSTSMAAVIVITSVRPRRWSRAAWGAVIGVAGFVGLAINLRWEVAIAGGSATTVAEGDFGWLRRIVSGAFDATIRPSVTGSASGALLLIGAALIVLLAVSLRRDPERWVVHSLLAAAVAGCGLSVLFLPTPTVWGLFVAFPLVAFGVGCLGRAETSVDPSRLLLAVSALYAAAVFVVQVQGAGGHQWGGRYLMLALPLAVPALLASCRRVLSGVSMRSATAAIAAVTVLSSVCVVLSMRALRDVRLASGLLSDTIGTALEESGDAGDGLGPVLISPVVQVGRQGWRYALDNRFVMVPRDEYPAYVQRLGQSTLDAVAVVDLYTSEDIDLYLDAGFDVTLGSASPIPLLEFFEARR